MMPIVDFFTLLSILDTRGLLRLILSLRRVLVRECRAAQVRFLSRLPRIIPVLTGTVWSTWAKWLFGWNLVPAYFDILMPSTRPVMMRPSCRGPDVVAWHCTRQGTGRAAPVLQQSPSAGGLDR